jgi:iron complex transport system substrate-binding protein
MKSQPLRIVSLIPSATEIVYLLGLGDFVVARSHDSNFPAAALNKPVVSQPSIPSNLTSRQIDDAVKQSLHTGTSLFHVDQKILQHSKPNLILTQELCAVCAPSFTQIKKAARILTAPVKLLSLEPNTVEDVFENILTVGAHTRKQSAAKKLVANLKHRVAEVERKTRGIDRPSAIVIEWLDPIMIAGHWVPQMVEKAGGKMLLSQPFHKSRKAFWQEILVADPDVLIFAPCGFSIDRAKREMEIFTSKPAWGRLRSVRGGKVYFVDGDAYFTRSGPRLVDGIEILAKIFHPNLFGAVSLSEAEKCG